MNIINSEKKKKGIGIIAAALALCITAGTVIGCSVAAKESAKKENDTKVTETEAPETDAPETDIPTWKRESLERRQEMHDFAEAFVKRDISKCAAIHRKYYYHSEDQSAAEERFAPLETLEFSKYDIEDVNNDPEYNDSIKMTFTIASSGYDAFPVGDYEGSLSIGPEGIYWKLQKPDDIALTEEEQAAVDFITPFFPYMSTDDEESAHRGMTLGIFRELEKISDDPSLEVRATLDEIQKAAFELYGMDELEPHESETQLSDDGYYTILGKCGDVSFQRIKNITKADDFYFIDVQYFDEPMYFTPANTVRYAVAETDTRFGYKLQKAEVIGGFKEEASPIFLPYQLQAYEGVWRIDNREDTTLTINKVNTETGLASLVFSFELSRSFSIRTTASIINDYYYFNDTENSGIRGRIRFYEKEIILIFDSFGSLPGYVGGWGSVYRFNTPENNWVIQNRVIPDVIPEFVQGDMKVYSPEDALKYAPYNFTFLPTYRDIYYWGPSFLYDLVDREDFRNWYNEVVAPDIESNTEPQEMYTVSFIKRFHITKEEFEQACEEKRLWFEARRDNMGEDISSEGYEIHNADIIYTFDNNIINNYYRRDICTYADVPNTTVDQNVTSVQNITTDQNISSDTETDEWIEQNKVDPAAVSKFVQGDMKVFSPEDAASKLPIKFDFFPKYRYIYYEWGFAFFSDFDVDYHEVTKWADEAVTPTSKGTGQSEEEPPEMYMVSFIKRFHIPKEEFERVCADRRAFMEQMPSYDVNGEAYELPNPDILYTFDNDIINEYYLRETCTYVD